MDEARGTEDDWVHWVELNDVLDGLNLQNNAIGMVADKEWDDLLRPRLEADANG